MKKDTLKSGLLWICGGIPFSSRPIGHQSMGTRGRSDDREPCTACEHGEDSSPGDSFSESAQLYSRVQGIGRIGIDGWTITEFVLNGALLY